MEDKCKGNHEFYVVRTWYKKKEDLKRTWYVLVFCKRCGETRILETEEK